MSIHSLNPIKKLDRRVRFFLLAGVVAFGLVAPGFLNNYVSAAQLTSRSIQPSTSAKGAQNINYTINFTSVGAAGAAVVEFCANSPFLNSACTAPTDFDVSAATSATTGFTDVTAATANRLVIAGTIAAGTPISVDVAHINNPSTVGAFYARLVTYDTKAHALNYDSSNLDNSSAGGSHVDDGGAAVSITDTIAVTAAVLETMTFCVAKLSISANCNLSGNQAPTIQLGEPVGTVLALSAGAVSTGTVNTQISTNAANGAIVSLKSGANGCGGLLRAGYGSACDILPAQNTDIAAGQPKFGVKTATATAVSTGSGTFEPIASSYYNNSTYALRYASDNLTGVTSPYGDPFLDTGGVPVNNMNMQLTFGASISNNTPAGSYSANISLIATGKF